MEVRPDKREGGQGGTDVGICNKLSVFSTGTSPSKGAVVVQFLPNNLIPNFGPGLSWLFFLAAGLLVPSRGVIPGDG